MLETVIEWDHQLFSLINGARPPIMDQVMLLLSDKYIWIPLYLWIVFKLTERYGFQILWVLVFITLAVTLSDQLTSTFMKPYFERLRPCRDPALADSIVIISRCGGKYGFASSHAANTMALATFCWMCFRNRIAVLITGWALLVGFSRIYLGVHFPGDVIVGALVGSASSLICYTILKISPPDVLRST